MATDTKHRPEKELHLPDSDITFRMTYVMMNDILRFVGSIEEAMTSIMTNQEVRDLIIRRLMTDNDKPIMDMSDLIAPEKVNIDIFEMDDALAWVVDHVTYFFMRMADRISKSVEKYPDMIEKMMTSSGHSATGSTASPPTSKSAGPTK